MAQLLKPGGNKLGAMRPLKLKEPKGMSTPHVPHFGGMIHTSTPGRTDNQNISVPHNSYIFPADTTSALGEGNSLAGAKVLEHLTSGGPSGGSAPAALNPVSVPGGMTPFAKGGAAKEHGNMIPIIVAGGEFHIMPQGVMNVAKKYGNGTMKSGHQLLDAFVKHIRAKNIKELKALPGPKK